MKIGELKLGQVQHEAFTHRESFWLPYLHQAILYDQWDNAEGFLLTTKTGSGKTVSAAFPIVDKRESAFFIYPTNALISDQTRSIEKMLEDFQIDYYYYNPDEDYDKVKANNVEIVLLKVDSDNLTKILDNRGGKKKGRALNWLLSIDKPILFLTNPDTLFLILALRYHQGIETWAHLQRFNNLVIDEFHLYRDMELANILFMIEYSKKMGFFQKFILLSATPDPEIQRILESLLHLMVIDPERLTQNEIANERIVAYPIELYPQLLKERGSEAESVLEIIQNKIGLDKLIELSQLKEEKDYVPLVVIFNSVINAIRFEDMLAKVIDRQKLGIFRGLSDRSIRSFEEKVVVIGTSAIEVGIDFKCDYLIFEASDRAGFIQRLGRVGRHAPGQAYLLCTDHVFRALKDRDYMARDDFEQLIDQIYTHLDARSWFIKTLNGIFLVYSLAQQLVKLVTKDKNSNATINKEVEEKTDLILDSYFEKLGAKRKYLELKLMLRSPHCKWMDVYQRNMSFRSSLVNLNVFDLAEDRRRKGKGYYQADIKTLLARGRIWKYDDKNDTVYITGYENRFKDIVVYVNVRSNHGEIYLTENHQELFITCDSEASSLGNKLLRENHIFTVVPDRVLDHIDWHLPVFKCQQGLLAFDGTALIISEIYNRYFVNGGIT